MCQVRGTCGPNAVCEVGPAGEPACSCPAGFSGIPRDGAPDPQHGTLITLLLYCCSAGVQAVCGPRSAARRTTRRPRPGPAAVLPASTVSARSACR